MLRPDVTPQVFGATLRAIRTERGLSQERFADTVGIHRTYVGALERGEKNPTLGLIYRVAAGLEIKGSDLLRQAEDAATKS